MSTEPHIPAAAAPLPLHPDPATAALLEFTPFPHKIVRARGWSPDNQRAFIAALAASGSTRTAGNAVGLAVNGAERLRTLEGGESFDAAWGRALEVYVAHRLDKVHADVTQLQSAAAAAATAPANAVDPAAFLHVVCDSCAATGIAGDPAFATIPDILDFDPVPPSHLSGGWDEAMQRKFVAALAAAGSIRLAARTVNRHPRVVEKLRKLRGGRSFSEACDAALEIARERELAAMEPAIREAHEARAEAGFPGGGYDDEEPSADAVTEVRDRIRFKMLGCRRLFLQEIAPDPEKRAAWDLLCGPVDWEKAFVFEQQPDEKARIVNMRQPDMVVTAGSGWMDSTLMSEPGAEQRLSDRITAARTRALRIARETPELVPYGPNRPAPFDGEMECPPENDDPNAVWVRAEDQEAASEALRDWQRGVDDGRIGGED